MVDEPQSPEGPPEGIPPASPPPQPQAGGTPAQPAAPKKAFFDTSRYHENANPIRKAGIAVKGNWQRSFVGKSRVLLGGLIGAGLGLSALKDMGQSIGVLSPDMDEDGKPMATDGKFFKGAAKLGGSALAVYVALAGGAKHLGVGPRPAR